LTSAACTPPGRALEGTPGGESAREAAPSTSEGAPGGESARQASPPRAAPLALVARAGLPLAEASGPGRRLLDGAPSYLAVGDDGATIFTFGVEGGAIAGLEAHDLTPLFGNGPSQWEAVAGDGTGGAFVLAETSGVVAVLSPDLGRVEHSFAPSLEGSPLADGRGRDANARGEGLLLLASGHLPVVMEREPVALIEFGPPGSAPEGYRPELAAGAGAFATPAGETSTFVALHHWALKHDDRDLVPDASELAPSADGRLFLASDRGRAVIRVERELSPGEDHLDVKAVARLPPAGAGGSASSPVGRAGARRGPRQGARRVARRGGLGPVARRHPDDFGRDDVVKYDRAAPGAGRRQVEALGFEQFGLPLGAPPRDVGEHHRGAAVGAGHPDHVADAQHAQRLPPGVQAVERAGEEARAPAVGQHARPNEGVEDRGVGRVDSARLGGHEGRHVAGAGAVPRGGLVDERRDPPDRLRAAERRRDVAPQARAAQHVGRAGGQGVVARARVGGPRLARRRGARGGEGERGERAESVQAVHLVRHEKAPWVRTA
jgi:hypothetical protein